MGKTNGAPRGTLIIMLKEPVMGRVKTRLAREIGAVAATRFARIAARNLVARLSRDRRWRTVLAIAPDGALRSRAIPADCGRIPQGRGDLGARMGRLLGSAPKPALLIGADIPAVTAGLVAASFKALAGRNIVFGPAHDGGYWLIGFGQRAPRHGLFRNIGWSTPFALSDTLANCAGYRVAFAPALSDVDDAESYCHQGRLAERLVPGGAHRKP